MRFLLPVYFIPLVEVSTHSSTSPATIDKGTVNTGQSECCTYDQCSQGIAEVFKKGIV